MRVINSLLFKGIWRYMEVGCIVLQDNKNIIIYLYYPNIVVKKAQRKTKPADNHSIAKLSINCNLGH